MAESTHPEPIFASERRDTERLMALWRREASKYKAPPPLTAFDFLSKSFRFAICANPIVGDQWFLIYGSRFARLLGLPESPAVDVALADQLSSEHLPLFQEGCDKALTRVEPVPISGEVIHHGRIELYRAVFLPLADPPKSQLRLILGSFNLRIGPTVTEAEAFCRAFNENRPETVYQK